MSGKRAAGLKPPSTVRPPSIAIWSRPTMPEALLDRPSRQHHRDHQSGKRGVGVNPLGQGRVGTPRSVGYGGDDVNPTSSKKAKAESSVKTFLRPDLLLFYHVLQGTSCNSSLCVVASSRRTLQRLPRGLR